MAMFTWPFPSNSSAPPLLGVMALAVAAIAAIMLAAGLVNHQARTVQAQDVAADRAALVALYDATDGDASWDESTGWKSDQPLGDWFGVTTNADGRVTSLIVADNNLTGSLPAELGNLSELEELAFYDNSLTGSIPPELGNLSKLETLNLRNNMVTGLIPPELGQLSNLDGLHLNNNLLYGTVPSELGNLGPVRLGVIIIENNQLIGELPHSFTRLTGLDAIKFGNNAGLCAPLDSAFQTWLGGTSRQGNNCPPAAIRAGTAAPVVGGPVTVRLTSREAYLARIQATSDEYDNDPCIGYDTSGSRADITVPPWTWERADADSNDPSLADGSTWTSVSAGRHPNATFVYLPQRGDVGKFLRASLTYGNPETPVTTEAIGPIGTDNGLTSADVVSVAAPTGTLRVGRTLT